MARIIESDLLQGADVQEDVNGVSVQRVFVVGELGPGSGTLLEARSMGPAYGEAHPDDSSIVVVKKRARPRLNSKTEAVLTVTYGPAEMIVLPTPIVRVRATTRGVRTNFDRDHNKIIVKFSGHADAIGQVEGQEAVGVLTADWIDATNPENWLMPYINTVNSSSWRGWPKWCWWVRDIQIEKELYRPGFKTSVAIEFNPNSFVKVAAWRDISGIVPKGIDAPTFPLSLGQVNTTDHTISGPGNGYTSCLINGERNFSGLKIP